MTKQERMIDKIKSLFALADNENAQGAEAENAMRMANKLLAKHALTMMDVSGGNEEVGISFKTFRYDWMKAIAYGVSSLYNCDGFETNRFGGTKFVLVGTDSNRITAEIVMDQLIDQVGKETRHENIAFRNSAAQSLRRNCSKIKKEREAEKVEIAPGTGIMPLDLIKQQELAVKKWMDDNIPKLKTYSTKKKASEAGAAYGSGLNPGARVNGSAQRRLS